MNIFYSMNNNYYGLDKIASDYTNDAELLTGLFYGLLKEAARTNRNGKGRAGRTVNTHMSFDTPEAREAAAASSAADTAKAAAKRQRNIENSFHFPKNDVSPAHLKEQARIKQTFRFADPEYKDAVLNRRDSIKNALLKKRNEAIDSLEKYVKFQDGQIDMFKRNMGRLTEKSAADLAELKARHIEDLAGVKAKSLEDIANLQGNLKRVRSLAGSRRSQIKNLTRRLKGAKLGMIGAGLGGLAAGAGGLALYNNYQNKTASADGKFAGLDLRDPELRRKLGYTGGGAALGGLVGALSSNENRTRNAIIGALLGGAGGYAFDRYGHKPTAEFINRRLKSKNK